MDQVKKLNVKIKKLHPGAVVPQYAHEFDSGFDLVAVEDVIVQPGQTMQVPTGLAFAIPRGWELQVRPRSGVSKKTKLRVSNPPGTVDSPYRGEVQVLIDNIFMVNTIMIKEALDLRGGCLTMDKEIPTGTYFIRKGDRIAQGVIAPVYQAEFEVVDELDETERGSGGFGSSGIKS